MEIIENKSLKLLNTFGIDVSARYYVEVNSPDELRTLTDDKKWKAEKKLILGGGSNILFSKNFDGIVIRNCMPGLTTTTLSDTEVLLKAGGGEVWHNLVMYCIEHNYAGIENLSLIPGCTGAAPMQNIGAYGVEIKDVFHELEAVSMDTGELIKFLLTDCEFGYRESVFKNKLKDRFAITSLSLRLTNLSSPKAIYRFKTDYGDIKTTLREMNTDVLSLKAVSDAVIKIRSSKLPDPKVIGNAGSFFKNPVIRKDEFEKLIVKYPAMPHYLQKDGHIKVPAGWLIEQCGWKGKRTGNTGSHKTQALVLVNYGGASGNEIWQLALDIQKSVKEKFDIEIKPEVNVI